MFDLMFGLFFVMFFVVFGMNVVRMTSQWNKNNHSPRLTVQATGAAKGSHPSTSYYATVQFESGHRQELHILDLSGHPISGI